MVRRRGTPIFEKAKPRKGFKFVNDSGKIDKSATVTIPVTGCTNYKDYTIEVTLTVSNKDAANIGAIDGVPATVTYGDANFTLTAEAENAGTGTGEWKWSSSDSSVLDVTGNGASAAVKVHKAGSATIMATYESDTTYGMQTASLTVNKKVLTLTAKNQSIYVNGTVPDLSSPAKDTHYTVTGLLDGDTLGGTITMKYQKDGADVATPDVTTTGSYDIAISGGDAGNNYKISYTPGTLTISRRSFGGGGGISQTTYTITVPEVAKNGAVSISPEKAAAGDTVTVTVTPDKGYTLETITVTDKDSKELTVTKKSDTQYTFTMPASKVTVKATFMDDNTMLNFFVDVKADDYFYDAVLWAVQKGITTGTEAVHFPPNASCTRTQIVTFLWRAAGSPEPKNSGSFTDVSADSYYARAVAWAVENGITGGTSDGKFSPDAACTREQAVTFLYRSSQTK